MMTRCFVKHLPQILSMKSQYLKACSANMIIIMSRNKIIVCRSIDNDFSRLIKLSPQVENEFDGPVYASKGTRNRQSSLFFQSSLSYIVTKSGFLSLPSEHSITKGLFAQVYNAEWDAYWMW